MTELNTVFPMRSHHHEDIRAFNCLTSYLRHLTNKFDFEFFFYMLNAKLSQWHPNTDFQDIKTAILGKSQSLSPQSCFQQCLGDSVEDTWGLQQVTEIIFPPPMLEISLIAAGWLLLKIFFCGDGVNSEFQMFLPTAHYFIAFLEFYLSFTQVS